MPRLESEFKPQFHSNLERLFPGCVLLKQDAEFTQGIPDTLMLFEHMWAAFEVKRKMPTSLSDFRPNQPWWLARLNEMSYAACVYPENEQEVLNDLEFLFAAGRQARHSQR